MDLPAWYILLGTDGLDVCDMSTYSFDCLHNKKTFLKGNLDTSVTIACLLCLYHWAFHSIDNNIYGSNMFLVN